VSLKQIPRSISEHPCGQLADRREAKLFTLRNSQELTVKLTSFGEITTELHVPDHAGNIDDIVLECKGVEPDTTEHPYFGANIGRVADRITQAQFERDQKIYHLPDNHKSNCLFGDEHELDSQLWDTHCPEIQGKSFIEFCLTDPDGSHGFPGNRQCNVRDSLSDAIERPYLRGTLLRPAQIFESNTSFRFFTKEAMDARH
jgi:aldose 1-epimerase